MKREEVSEGIVFCCCKGQKQRHWGLHPLNYFFPRGQNKIWEPV
jgi:hypothetical protein